MLDLPLIGNWTVCCVSEDEPASSEGGDGINGSSISESSMLGKWWVRIEFGLINCSHAVNVLDVCGQRGLVISPPFPHPLIAQDSLSSTTHTL